MLYRVFEQLTQSEFRDDESFYVQQRSSRFLHRRRRASRLTTPTPPSIYAAGPYGVTLDILIPSLLFSIFIDDATFMSQVQSTAGKYYYSHYYVPQTTVYHPLISIKFNVIVTVTD